MSEDKSEVPNPGRRNAIKVGAVALGALFLGREVKTFQEGVISTSSGDFYPLYEAHDIGIESSSIPTGLDAFFRELVLREQQFNDNPLNLINKKFKDENGIEHDKKNVEFPTLKVLAENGTKLVYGDLLPADDFNAFLDDRIAAKFRRVEAGGIIAVSGSMYSILTKLIDRISHAKPSEQVLSRRKFLFGAIAPLAIILEAPLIQVLIDKGASYVFPSPDQQNAAQRVIQRINTLLSIAEPEDHVVFFRSVVMADKMLTVAERIQQETGKKPRMAFQVGNKHSIMEDLLIAGHNFNRLILASYPQDFLETAIKAVGGVENFSSARVFTLNPNMTQQDVNEGSDEKVIVREERIIDQPLQDTLVSKLVA